MDRRAHQRLPSATAAGVALLFWATFASEASAHVKWFSAFDVATQPRGLENVFTLDFGGLVGTAILALTAGCLLDGTAIGEALLHAFDRVTSGLRTNTEI